MAIVGQGVVTTCLENRRQVGMDLLGATGHVLARIVRSDSPALFAGTRRETVETYTIPQLGVLLVASRRTGNGSFEDLT